MRKWRGGEKGKRKRELRDRERERDRQTDRQTETEKESPFLFMHCHLLMFKIHPFCVKLGKSKIDMLFNIYSLTKVHVEMCYCCLSFKAFVFKYKIFSEQYNEIFDLGFYTMCSFLDTKSNIL